MYDNNRGGKVETLSDGFKCSLIKRQIRKSK